MIRDWQKDCTARSMRLRICYFVASLTLLSLIHTNPVQGANQNERFSGTWQAKVQDSVICTIELRVTPGIAGSMEDCRIHTDADGNLVKPEPSDASSKPSPISNARITGAVLSFECRDEDEAEPARFEMTLIKEGVADLVVKNAPVQIKPIRFARISSAK